MKCHICDFYTEENGCDHYSPAFPSAASQPAQPIRENKTYFKSEITNELLASLEGKTVSARYKHYQHHEHLTECIGIVKRSEIAADKGTFYISAGNRSCAIPNIYSLEEITPAASQPDTDLFEHLDELPENVRQILERFAELDSDSYNDCGNLVKELNAVGYTCDYYLDGVPFNLRKLPQPAQQPDTLTIFNRLLHFANLWKREQFNEIWQGHLGNHFYDKFQGYNQDAMKWMLNMTDDNRQILIDWLTNKYTKTL